MASPLSWPGKYFFYPIGNHSAVCLTRDLPPELPADILLLSCGDPRNILYTISCETPLRRTIDFTCCDYDPGILARDVLLFTMIMDGIQPQSMWKIFADMYLDDESARILQSQCRTLLNYSASEHAWRGSPYGSVLRMGTEFTLIEVRRHWSLYLEACSATGERALAIRRSMDNGREKVLRKYYGDTNDHLTLSTGRSSGPLFLRAFPVYTAQLGRYWTTGTTSAAIHPSAAPQVNPTFLYTRAGEGFTVHYGTDPLSPFHLAHIFGNDLDTPTVSRIVTAAQAEFKEWCDSFRDGISQSKCLTVRFLLGDAFSVAAVLKRWNEGTAAQSPPIPIAPWTCKPLRLSLEEYEHSHAPTLFHVIDTSNMADYAGTFNILLASIPLLSRASPLGGVLYTESFLTDSDPSKQLHSILIAHPSVLCLLLDLVPVGALSGFVTECNTHEWLPRSILTYLDGPANRYHQVITWKRPWAGDSDAFELAQSLQPVELSPPHLATFLYGVYDRLFGGEDPTRHANLPRISANTAVLDAAYNTRNTFVIFLHILRARLCLSDDQWSDVMRLFLEEQRSRSPHAIDSCSYRELDSLLYRGNIFLVPSAEQLSRPSIGRLQQWRTIPPLVRIYLSVPRVKLAALTGAEGRFPGGIPLHCVLQMPSGGEHMFQVVDTAFGRVVDVGTTAEPAVVISEGDRSDISAAHSDSPLVLSFVVLTRTLTDVLTPERVIIRLSVERTMATVPVFMSALGLDLCVFAASFEDREHVHVVPERRLPPPSPLRRPEPYSPSFSRPLAIGKQCPIHVELDGARKTVETLTARLLVENARAKTTFSGGAMPIVTQSSPCAMSISLGSQVQIVAFPVPIAGSQRKVRLARKSSYIEIVVPVALPALGNPDRMNINPFTVVRAGSTVAAPTMHRLHLDRLPPLDTNNPWLERWLNTHVSSQFSLRESKMKRGELPADTLAQVKDTIHSMMLRSVGHLGNPVRRVFALRDNTSNDSDTIFFVKDLRYDLCSHTAVCDAFVLPLFPELMATLTPWFGPLINSDISNSRIHDAESRAWKQLLPALVERCRTWTHGTNCEYVVKGRIPLSLEVNGGDPLCSCGRGKNVEGMREVELWRPFAPFVTRIALSPLFAVPYLEPVAPGLSSPATGPGPTTPASAATDPTTTAFPALQGKYCKKCGKVGKGMLKSCGGCKEVFYCSKECQKADWASHKIDCAGRRA